MQRYDLKEMALKKYGSCIRFSQEMEWNKRKGWRILNGEQELTLCDIKRIAERMELSDEAIVALFFGTMFTE